MSHIPISISCGSPRQFGARKHYENSKPGQSFLCSCVVSILRPEFKLIKISGRIVGTVPQLPSNKLFLYFNGDILCVSFVVSDFFWKKLDRAGEGSPEKDCC